MTWAHIFALLLLKHVSSACQVPWTYSSPHYFTSDMYEYTLLLLLPTWRELDLVVTGLLHNNVITLVIIYDLPDTWYLHDLSWMYLLLTSQILYRFVKHMQRHANNEHSGKIYELLRVYCN